MQPLDMDALMLIICGRDLNGSYKDPQWRIYDFGSKDEYNEYMNWCKKKEWKNGYGFDPMRDIELGLNRINPLYDATI